MNVDFFNLPHILTITLIPIAIFFGLYFGLRKCEENTIRQVLLWICIFNAVLYVVYKVVQFFQPTYEFYFLLNLPLHFCNLNLILLPLAIYLRNKYLMAYQFYFGVCLAAIALLAIDPAFRGAPLLDFTTITYFYYHSFLMVAPILLIAFRLYRPSFKNVWQPTVFLVGLTAIIHLINMFLRGTGLAPTANYFFTYGLRGDPLTEIYWSIIPYEFFFLLPALLSFAPFIILTTLPFYLKDRKAEQKAAG